MTTTLDLPAALPGHPSKDLDGGTHAVQLYETREVLAEAVADYLGTGLSRGEIAFAVLRADHAVTVRERLAAAGHALDELEAKSKLVMLDAEATLAKLLAGGMPSAERFDEVVGSEVRRLNQGGSRPLRAYGEMVDVLWTRGQAKAALMLEANWNALLRSQPVSLLCAYRVGHFEKDARALATVCAEHSHFAATVPDETAIRLAMKPLSGLADDLIDRARVDEALRASARDLRTTSAELRRSESRIADFVASRSKTEEMYAEAARRSERLMLVTAAVAEAIEPEEVHEALVERVGAALDASSAALWVLDDDNNTVRLARSFGYPERAVRAVGEMRLDAVQPLPVIDAMRTGRPVWIDSQTELLERYPHMKALTTAKRSYRISCLPIVCRGRTLGALAFTFDDAPPIDDGEQSFLELVARYGSQALERLRLVRMERAFRQRTELLHALTAAVIRASRVEEVFDAALEAIGIALGTARCSILAYDPDGVMRFKAWRGLSDGYRRAVEGHSPWTRDTKSPPPLVIADAAADPSVASYAPIFESESIRALAFIPLVAGERLIGKFMVYYETPRNLSPADLALAGAIANHVATAIERFSAIHELERTVHFNELFTGMLGHDLRNPLGAIMAAAQLAAARTSSEELAAPLRRIRTSGKRMARMIEQLLDFTRLRVGQGIPIVPKNADVLRIVTTVMGELEIANPNANLVPPRAEGPTTGVWDADRLHQVFSNLVGNAIRHGQKGGTVSVEIDGTRPESIRISIHNEGSIAPDDLPTLFEPPAGHRRRPDSLGLGLYISKEIVTAHGGTLEVKTSVEEGTTFTAILPRGSDSEP